MPKCKLLTTVYLAAEIEVEYELTPDGKAFVNAQFGLPHEAYENKTAVSRGAFIVAPDGPVLTDKQQQTLISYAALALCEAVHVSGGKEHKEKSGLGSEFTFGQKNGGLAS